MGKGNNMIPNVHCHKHWQRHIKTWFNQPTRKLRRRINRCKKIKSLFPRPLKKLYPKVQCPSIRYNTKSRLGRGFSLQEVKKAGFSPKYARSIGISVDHFRHNKSIESLLENVQRLKEYKEKIILYPINERQSESGNIHVTVTNQKTIMKLLKTKPVIECRKITESEKKFCAFSTMKKARSDLRLVGKREKLSKLAAENILDSVKLPADKKNDNK